MWLCINLMLMIVAVIPATTAMTNSRGPGAGRIYLLPAILTLGLTCLPHHTAHAFGKIYYKLHFNNFLTSYTCIYVYKCLHTYYVIYDIISL